MSHFSKDGIENDPDGHARLKEILHGRNVRVRAGSVIQTKPSLATRFEGRRADRDAPCDHLRLVSIDGSER